MDPGAPDLTNLADPAAWPEPLRWLVAQVGSVAVWNAGLECLGYPPTWAETGKEFVTVARALGQPLSRK